MIVFNSDKIIKAFNCIDFKDLNLYLHGIYIKYNKEDKSVIYVGSNGSMLYKGKEVIEDNEEFYSYFSDGKIIWFDKDDIKSIKLHHGWLVDSEGWKFSIDKREVKMDYPDFDSVINNCLHDDFNEKERDYYFSYRNIKIFEDNFKDYHLKYKCGITYVFNDNDDVLLTI